MALSCPPFADHESSWRQAVDLLRQDTSWEDQNLFENQDLREFKCRKNFGCFKARTSAGVFPGLQYSFEQCPAGSGNMPSLWPHMQNTSFENQSQRDPGNFRILEVSMAAGQGG